MSFHSWLHELRSALTPRRRQRHHARRGSLRAATHRLNLEALEDRRLLAFSAPVDYAGDPWDVKAGDFNNDGRLDLATANVTSNTVSVLLGNANGTFQPALTSAAGSPGSLTVGDFNADGKLDLATVNAVNVSVLLGNGHGTFQAPSSMGVDGSAASVAVGDFNGDGLLDLGVTSNIYHPYIPAYWDYYGNYYPGSPGYHEGRANVLVGMADALGKADGTFSGPYTTYLGDGFHSSAAVADFNRDGKQDLATAKYEPGAVSVLSVLLGDSRGYLLGPSRFSTGDYSATSHSVAAGDLDADGDTDLVTANYDAKNVSVLLGDGLGSFGGPTNYTVGFDGPISIVLGDFTRDGNLDVATTNYHSKQVSVLYGDGDGAFSAPALSATGSRPFAVAAGDFNGDGWLDAATANPADDNSGVSVLINNQFWPDPPSPQPPWVSINDPSAVLEGNTGSVDATFTVTLSAVSDVDVTVHYVTADITAAPSTAPPRRATATTSPGPAR